MLTTWVNKKNVQKDWYIIDATDLVFGRLAAFLAIRLMGKHKSNYCPNIDCGDNFVVVNAKNIIAPPIIVTKPGTSPTPIQTHKGAKTGSTNANKPTCAAGTYLVPSTIRAKPTPTWKTPR